MLNVKLISAGGFPINCVGRVVSAKIDYAPSGRILYGVLGKDIGLTAPLYIDRYFHFFKEEVEVMPVAKKAKKKKLKDFYDLKVDGISQSGMKTFMTCRRKWMLNIGGLSKKDMQKNTHFGTIVHELLDKVYQNPGLTKEELPDFISKELDEYLEKNKDAIHIDQQQNDTEKEMAKAIVEAYFEFYEKDKENFINVEPECEFETEYNDVLLRGKIDGVITMKNGETWQLEHKTKSRVDEEGLLQALQFDFQNLMYCFVLEKSTPVPIKGVVYNIIRKPQLKVGKAESPSQFLNRVKLDIKSRPEFYFIRYEIVYSTKDRRKFKKQLDGVLGEMKMFIDGVLPDTQNPISCISPFKCEYLGICANNDTHGLEVRKTMHPELDKGTTTPKSLILEHYGIKL